MRGRDGVRKLTAVCGSGVRSTFGNDGSHGERLGGREGWVRLGLRWREEIESD